ncbi:MAG: amine dehydrogenase [Loktanella sp.]|nr:amine dehydrogenase [Loktanella sp.]
MTKLIDTLLSRLDRAAESGSRAQARSHGRRSFLARLGGTIVGAAVMTPILPFDRRANAAAGAGGDVCAYWRNCALDGFLCQETGGSMTSCPVGSEASAVSWVGTCHNPEDERDYLVSYNDCCGKAMNTTATFCFRSERERPGYRMGLYNDINWCMANSDAQGYYCTVAVVVGQAT